MNIDQFGELKIENKIELDIPIAVDTDSHLKNNKFLTKSLLLTIVTLGSSFFYLPWAAKNIGFTSVFILLVFSATLHFTYNMILYEGFKASKGKTYNECMSNILGNRMGYISNIFIFIHVFNAVLSMWVFSYKYINSGMIVLFDIKEEDASYNFFKYGYFFITFFVLYFASLVRKIEKLKIFAYIGFGILIYIILVFSSQTPSYHEHYILSKKMNFVFFKSDIIFFKVFGICLYLFFNQFSLISICNGLKTPTRKNFMKIVGSSISVLFIIYSIVIVVGYLSEPDIPTNEVFLLRKSIKSSDILILIGRCGFGLTLLIGTMLKCFYLFIYLDQLIDGIKSLGKPQIKNKNTKEKKSDSIFRLETGLVIRNFFFFIFIGVLALLLIKKLASILSITGSFIGFFEIIFFPTLILCKMSLSNPNLITKTQKLLLLIFSGIVGILCICSTVYNVIFF